MTDKITGGMPTAKVLFGFLVLETFDLTDPLGNIVGTYVGEQRYQVREGNTHLEALAREWDKDGKVRIGG